MAEDLLNNVRDGLEGQIDFRGQELVDQLSTYMLSIVGVLCFLVGYITQNINYSLWTGLGGTAITMLALVPPWPWFKQHPEKWLPSQRDLAGLNLNIST